MGSGGPGGKGSSIFNPEIGRSGIFGGWGGGVVMVRVSMSGLPVML